jgi:hypothetical protein
MLTAFYIGNHKDDGWLARVGYVLIRAGQWLQRFGRATHCEAILQGPWWAAEIAGASRRDGAQVRVKTVALTPGNWLILDVPAWDLAEFRARLQPLLGAPYSDLGAAASASVAVGFLVWLLGKDIAGLGQWCSRTLLQCAGVEGAEDASVAEAMTIALALPGTRDVTDEYFSGGPDGR